MICLIPDHKNGQDLLGLDQLVCLPSGKASDELLGKLMAAINTVRVNEKDLNKANRVGTHLGG